MGQGKKGTLRACKRARNGDQQVPHTSEQYNEKSMCAETPKWL